MSPILVIKHGALGDLIQAFGPFAAIRAHHPGARIDLLTTPPFAALMRRAPWFDRVLEDPRAPAWNLPASLRLARSLAREGYARVYDLQTSARSSRLFHLMRLFGARPEWSGIARGCSHPHANPDRDRMHTLERQRDQLAAAGITTFPPPDLAWLDADLARFSLPARFALLVPGASPQRPEKRWPAEHYAALAATIAAQGATPVIVGTAAEAPLAAAIRQTCPAALDLTGRTTLVELAALARRALFAVGNDTGPMHLIAALGRPAVVLFSAASDPALCAPRGQCLRILRAADLRDLQPQTVLAALAGLDAVSAPSP
ncbi:glycosyltransferase family 9 protein [Elioraea thermophila]|uniref:glycosyltransferase family 9 protein n=1 Tax=Elioraea thermophila TaxID=2185104 RepID=UPI000DF14DC7|nr:glycosyltransferase family 9 protein [Elioraea thermophila]